MVEVMKKVSGNYVMNANEARKAWPGAVVLDVTKDGGMGVLDPATEWGSIEIPGMEKKKALTLMGLWEGMKVFERKGADESFSYDEKKIGKERGYKCYGKLIGIKNGEDVVDLEKGKEIFSKKYETLVKERFEEKIEILKKTAKSRTVVLLDYEEGLQKPWSHAEALKRVIEGVA